MSHEYSFEFVKTPEQLGKLRKFAATFDHKIYTAQHPLLVFKRDGEWVGHFQIVTSMPIVFPAWNPHVCNARDVVEGTKRMIAWGEIQHGGGFVTVPLDTKSFVPDVMTKLGFSRMNMELYEKYID